MYTFLLLRITTDFCGIHLNSIKLITYFAFHLEQMKILFYIYWGQIFDEAKTHQGLLLLPDREREREREKEYPYSL